MKGCGGNEMANMSFKLTDGRRVMIVCGKIKDCDSGKSQVPFNDCLTKLCQFCDNCKRHWIIGRDGKNAKN